VQSYVLEIHLTLCSLAQCLHDRDLVEFPQVVRRACAWWTGASGLCCCTKPMGYSGQQCARVFCVGD
jgi:hypothetical protein